MAFAIFFVIIILGVNYNRGFSDILKKNIKWVLLFLFSLFFILILLSLYMMTELNIDMLGNKYIVEGLRNTNLNEYIIILTNLGGAIVLIGVCLFSILFFKDKRYGKYIAINLVTITLINLIIKMIVHRDRPLDIGLIVETSYSFPSGHAMVSMAFYGFLIYLIYHKVKNPGKKFFCCTSLSLIILFIGFSRIYLGVHYTSDVLAGYSFSLGYLIIYTHIVGKKLR